MWYIQKQHDDDRVRLMLIKKGIENEIKETKRELLFMDEKNNENTSANGKFLKFIGDQRLIYCFWSSLVVWILVSGGESFFDDGIF